MAGIENPLFDSNVGVLIIILFLIKIKLEIIEM
jgi:hypothetical protein